MFLSVNEISATLLAPAVIFPIIFRTRNRTRGAHPEGSATD